MTARTLVLLRHAKAESPAGTTDEQRPLSARGHGDARAAGAWLAGRYLPDLVLCSPSKRTRQTWHGVATSLASLGVERAPYVRYDARLYGGDEQDLLDTVRETDEAAQVLLVVGHNPAVSRLAYDLAPEGGLDSDGIRTCGLTVHTIESAWSDCAAGQARLVEQHTARGD